MIQKNELRVGNWVNDVKGGGYNSPGYQQVKNIGENGVNGWQDMGASGCAKYENIKPILLTPKILEQCGVIRLGDTDNVHSRYAAPNDNNFYLEIDWRRRDEGFNPLVKNYDEYATIGMNIKYLHQLQNLYFALTGEELQINL